MSSKKQCRADVAPLSEDEKTYYRDKLREARYSALADAEGFHAICFALEALGMRLCGKKEDLGTYKVPLRELSLDSAVLTELSEKYPQYFSTFEVLFDFVRSARNDAMHTGVYARHVTSVAIELCIGLEEAIMKSQQEKTQVRNLVKHFMVKSPIFVEPWQPIAHARQIMLTHSFSFLPVCLDDRWRLISEGAMARYLRSSETWKNLLSLTIKEAAAKNLALHEARVVQLEDKITDLLCDGEGELTPRLWLVLDEHQQICGVLSPFELM